jgi:rhodanese-related sulfurtransferase
METISATGLSERLKAGTVMRLLDVRQPEEFEIAALPGATLIPLNSLPERVGEIEAWKDEEVVVYCHHGMRSAHAISWLSSQGFGKLTNLTGGIDRWSVEVDPKIPRY